MSNLNTTASTSTRSDLAQVNPTVQTPPNAPDDDTIRRLQEEIAALRLQISQLPPPLPPAVNTQHQDVVHLEKVAYEQLSRIVQVEGPKLVINVHNIPNS